MGALSSRLELGRLARIPLSLPPRRPQKQYFHAKPGPGRAKLETRCCFSSLARNSLRNEKGAEVGIAARHKRAGWKTDCLQKVLSQ